MEVQKSQKGADDIIMKRKIYQQLLDWKEKRNGEVALLVEGARRIGKSYIVEEFAKNEYEYAAKSLQLCLTLCDPIDSSPLGSSVPGNHPHPSSARNTAHLVMETNRPSE